MKKQTSAIERDGLRPLTAIVLGVMFSAVVSLSACGGGSGAASGGSSPSSTSDSTPGTAPASDPPPAPGVDEPAPEPIFAPAPVPLPTPVADAVPLPPPSQQLPSGVETSNPGVVVKPVAVTSSATEGQGSSAAMAIDGEMATRWASAHEDGAWIQFDFGMKTQLGYMKLVWENAYGKEYALEGSDDGKTWYQLRYVAGGKGGTEEFFNLNANVRYVRVRGVARATQYGYSLFEVEFKGPGSDNSLPVLATSAVKFPASGTGLAPAPAAQDPLEVLQFSLPDGTLITRFGARAVGRHGRERGEAWNESGYGPNETVDPITGQPLDKGPGSYLIFVKNYFKNRTWGFEIIDNSRVAGVTKPTLKVNEYFQQRQLPGGMVWFRNFADPRVTGYGWMRPGELVDKSVTICPVVPYPPNGK